MVLSTGLLDPFGVVIARESGDTVRCSTLSRFSRFGLSVEL